MRSRWWYVVAALVAAVGWIVAVAFTAGTWDELRGSTVIPSGQPFDAEGHDVAVLTDLPQPGRDIACEAVGPGEERTEISSDSIVDVTVTTDGTRWHLIALMEDGRADMTAECTPGDELSDSASYGYALVNDLDGRDLMGSLIAWVSLTAGIVLAAVTAWRRRATS